MLKDLCHQKKHSQVKSNKPHAKMEVLNDFPGEGNTSEKT